MLVPGGVPIKVEFGGEKFAIPSNYFDFPYQHLGTDGDYDVTTGVALTGTAPDFAHRGDAEGVGDFHVKYLNKSLHVITNISNPPDGRAAVGRILTSELQSSVLLSELDSDYDVQRVYETEDPLARPSKLKNIYVAKDGSSFVVCYAKRPDQVASHCSDFVGYGSLVVQIDYSSVYVPDRVSIRSRVIKAFDSWHVP